MGKTILLIALLIQGAAWGGQFAMLKLALSGGYNEVTVLFVALVFISAGYFGFLFIRKSVFRPVGGVVIFFSVTAILGYVAPLLVAVYSAPHLPAGMMTLIACLSPVVTVLTALLLRTERVSKIRIAAIVMGVISVILVFTPELMQSSPGLSEWLLFMCLVPLFYGVESIYVAAYWPQNLDAWHVGFGEAAFAAIMLIPCFILFGKGSMPVNFSSAEMGILLFVVFGLIEVVLYFYIIQQTGGVLVSFSYFISLFAGIGWGMLIFYETHSNYTWFAVAVLIGALLLLGIGDNRRKEVSRST